MPDDKTPFPFPPGYETKLENKYKAKSIRDYISLFERGRSIRKDGKLADADIQEIMRLAEDLGRVDTTEIDVMRALVDQRPEYFRDEAQQDELESFARVHILKDTIRQDPLVADILDAAPISFYRKPEAIDWMRTAQELARVMRKNEAYYDEHDTFDPGLIDELDKVAQELGDIIKDDADFTLSDIDDVAARARKSFFRDVKNFLLRSVGETDHESKFDDGQWVNWNRDIEVYPERYLTPANRAEAVDIVKRHNPVRMVAGGHTFNISPSMGGDEGTPQGTLVSLDAYAIDADRRWQRIDAGAAQQKYNLPDDEAKRVVRASAGIRLRDFGDEMWAERMTLPVAGSTDAQSLGGLVATDLHSTGHTAGFLSQQILEIIAIDGNGALVHFVKNEGVARRTPGRWTVNFADSTQQKMGTLAAAGAIGTCGAVIEVVLKLDTAFNLEKSQHFVPRRWAEDNIDKLIDSADHGEHFDYDHVSMYYPGGAGMTPTVRMNTWKRTNKRVSSGVEILKAIRELFDHVGSAFLPKTLLNLARRKAATPGDPPRPDDDDWLASLNRRKPLVLPANKAFARQLFFSTTRSKSAFRFPPPAA